MYKKLKDDIGGHPMMSDKEIEIMDQLFEKYKPKTVLEWGSGNSTVYFPKKHIFIEEWMALEHDKTYLELLQDVLPENAYITVMYTDERYEKYPSTLGKKFDFIFVDGIRRDECIDEAFNLLNEGGVIVLHDWDRIEAKNIVEKYKGKFEILSKGELPQENGYNAHRGLILFHGR